MKKIIITTLVILCITTLVGFMFSQKSMKSVPKKEKIVVKGPKAKFDKGFMLFMKKGDNRPIATQGSNYIEADYIKYFSDKNMVISESNVIFRNFEKQAEILSEYLEFYGDNGDLFISGNPRMYISNQSLYSGGEKVSMNIKEDKIFIDKKAYITNENIRAYSDRVEYISEKNLAKMFGNVKVFSLDINVFSDVGFVYIFSNEVSNYIAYGNVISESKNIKSRSEGLIAFFKLTNQIDNYTMITNVTIDGKDLYVESFSLSAVVSNIYEDNKTNTLTYYTFYSNPSKRVFYNNKKEDTQLECDLLEVILDQNNELISSTAKGKVRVLK